MSDHGNRLQGQEMFDGIAGQGRRLTACAEADCGAVAQRGGGLRQKGRRERSKWHHQRIPQSGSIAVHGRFSQLTAIHK
jgi:hypothetical protein